jgi:hypothetical protein
VTVPKRSISFWFWPVKLVSSADKLTEPLKSGTTIPAIKQKVEIYNLLDLACSLCQNV